MILHPIHSIIYWIFNRLNCQIYLLYVLEIMSIPSHIPYSIVPLTPLLRSNLESINYITGELFVFVD